MTPPHDFLKITFLYCPIKRARFGTFILDGKYVFWQNFVVFGRVVHFLSAFEVKRMTSWNK